MKKAGVVGYPVKQSLSPRLHGYWLKQYNINGEYKAYEVAPENLPDFTAGLRAGFSGVNLTIPHKETIVTLLDEVDEIAQTIGAVNTIIIKNQKLVGTNTDAYGFAENIRPHIKSTKKSVLLGAGGAAKAVVFALKEMGFEEIIITNRTKKNAEQLGQAADWDNRNKILENIDLLVNTTSLGMVGCEPLDIDLSLLPKTALVTDIVYKPLITPLLAQAQARGNLTIDGLGMLLHQAVPAFEAWFGVRPEVTDELRKYILEG